MKLPSQARALLQIRRLLSDWTGIAVDHLVPGRLSKSLARADLVVRAGEVTLVVEYKGSAEAAILHGAIEQSRAYAKSASGTAIPVVAVPYMGDLGKALCERAGVSWLDLSGNARIVAPGIIINVQGQPNQFKRPGRPSSVFAPKSARIARWFLTHPNRSLSQRELSRVTKLDEGFASRVARRLVEDGYLAREDAGLRLANPDLLLDAWRDTYDFSKHTILRGHITARSGEELLAHCAAKLMKLRAEHAATGLGAAWLLAKFSGFRLTTLYLAEPPETALLGELGFRPDERGANTWLVVPNDQGVFDEAATVQQVRCVQPVQVYLDLKGHPERAAEAASDLRARLLQWGSG
jgi:hypothetical protein